MSKFAQQNFFMIRNNHFLVFFSACILLFSCSNGAGQDTVRENSVIKLSAEKFKYALDSIKDVQLVDVRTLEEFSGSHLQNALHNDIYEAEFSSRNQNLDKDKPVFVYCKGGARSAQAAEQLKKAGFRKVYDLEGGIMAWNTRNFPVEKSNAGKQPDKFTEKEFDALIKGDLPVMFDFYASWCMPCKKMEPIISKLSREYQGRVIIKRVNVDEATAVSKRLGISALPYVTTYKKGLEYKHETGFRTEEELRDMLNHLLEK